MWFLWSIHLNVYLLFIMFLCGKTCLCFTDELRMAVKEVICNDPKEREKYKEALVAITVDESLKR